MIHFGTCWNTLEQIGKILKLIGRISNIPDQFGNMWEQLGTIWEEFWNHYTTCFPKNKPPLLNNWRHQYCYRWPSMICTWFSFACHSPCLHITAKWLSYLSRWHDRYKAWSIYLDRTDDRPDPFPLPRLPCRPAVTAGRYTIQDPSLPTKGRSKGIPPAKDTHGARTGQNSLFPRKYAMIIPHTCNEITRVFEVRNTYEHGLSTYSCICCSYVIDLFSRNQIPGVWEPCSCWYKAGDLHGLHPCTFPETDRTDSYP